MKPASLTPNGCAATFEIDTQRNVLYGEGDVVAFEGTTVDEAARAFQASVD